MRVLVNALSARKGGIVTYTNNLLTALEERGIDIIVSVPMEFENQMSPSISRLDIGGFSPLQRFLWEQFVWRGIVKKHNPDVLFSSANFGLLRSPVKQVLLLREGGLFDPFYLANMTAQQGVGPAISRNFRRRLMLRSAASADHIITPTKAMRDMVANWQPSAADKCSVNPYGTIDEMFKPGDAPRRWRFDGKLRMLYVSVYYPHKAPSLLCQAADALNRDGIPSHATITMAKEEFNETRGGALDDEIISEAEARDIASLGHYDYSDLPDLYRSHDVFVFPSVSETFGHPMAEAMSSGLPVLASDTPVNREICGDAALYFKPFSVSGLVERLKQLDQDQDLRDQLAEKGRERVLERFGWEDHVDRLINTFEAVASGVPITD